MSILEDRLGADHAATVVERLGGCSITVPDRLDDERVARIERQFGRELAVLIVLHFGGTKLYVPHGESRKWNKLDDVVRMTKARKSASFIARELRCSDRTVYAWRRRAKAAGLLPTRIA